MTTTNQHLDHSLPKPPGHEDIPPAKPRAVRRGAELTELRVRLEVVTPILGGGVEHRSVDKTDIIRTPTVRGHLRFWWRALYASQCSNVEDLYKRESALWGRAATDGRGRSVVETRVSLERTCGIDGSDINLQHTPGAYALWPARAEKKQGRILKPPAERRMPGTRFLLALKTPSTCEVEVKNALRAWILFGGYGGRTRRGLGSLKVLENAGAWLPVTDTREALSALFGFDIFALPNNTPGDVPTLGGAALHVRPAVRGAQNAWTTALDWLKEFRQGTSGQQGARAREPSSDPRRPSISNWPEADKLRHLKKKTRAHPPKHNPTVSWPRAGLGLPIIGQFQTTDRNGTRNAYDEPGKFELRWRAPKMDRPHEFDEYDRLASPLIVKALPLVDRNGTVTFAPCALWLNRSYPQSGQVGVARPKQGRPNEKEIDPATAAPFISPLVANDDKARFSALENKATLRQAFLDWLQARYQTTVVAA